MDPEYFLRLDLTVQRWVYFKLNSKMEELKPPVQFPSQDKLQSMAKKEELETFQICGVLYKNRFKFDFIFTNGLKAYAVCAQMTENLINPAGAQIRKIETHNYLVGGMNKLEGLRFLDKDGNTLLECGEFAGQSNSQINHTMVIHEHERVIGVRSKTKKDASEAGNHYDIEFLVC